MGAFRNRTDEVLDAKSRHDLEVRRQLADPNSSMSKNKAAAELFA